MAATPAEPEGRGEADAQIASRISSRLTIRSGTAQCHLRGLRAVRWRRAPSGVAPFLEAPPIGRFELERRMLDVEVV